MPKVPPGGVWRGGIYYGTQGAGFAPSFVESPTTGDII